MLKISNQ